MNYRIDPPDSIRLIDVNLFGTPEISCSYLVDAQETALIETGPATVFQTLSSRLESLKAEPRQIIVTHIHLDHSGAAGHFAKRFPDATIWVHEIGAPHLIDPTKLVSSARRVFGDALDSWYGEPIAIDASRIRTVTDGDVIDLGNRQLRILHTPGHAAHEITIVDEDTQTGFVGDTAGVFLGSAQFRPATPPPEFDFELALASIDRLIDHGLNAIAFTHFGLAATTAFPLIRDALVRWNEILEPMHLDDASDEQMIEALEADSYRGTTDYVKSATQMNSTRMCVAGFRRYYKKRP